jgi:uncharacterized protein
MDADRSPADILSTCNLIKHLLATTALLLSGYVLCERTLKAAEGIAVSNRAPLEPNAFNPLPLGAITPRGWLLRQERIQADGLTGHLDEFWNDVGPNSGWLGGTGEAWERGPYYLDGLLPLAYQLEDAKLIAKAKRWVDWTLNSQRADGQFGPAANDDWWPRMVMLKVITQYAEVTGDAKVIPFLTSYFRFQLQELPKRPLRDWGRYRWQDNAYSVLWLYNRTGDVTLLSLFKLLHEQGYDWEAQFDRFRFTNKSNARELGLGGKGPIPDLAMQTHGVNNAMALKAAPIWWLATRDTSDRTALYRQLAMLDEYHGLPNGMFSADEHLAGSDPSQGTELCTVVEAMFSYEQDFAILGDAALADRLERVAYNALPATLSEDMWSHQYDQQPNQIACTRAHRQWSTNGPDSNLFGLAPNFGCCTANLHQGWPKFVSALWMSTPDGGLVTTAYAPSQVHANIAGADVTVTEDTLYPFRGDVSMKVELNKPAAFALLLRMPKWAATASVKVNGSAQDGDADGGTEAGFFRIRRVWKEGDSVQISFPMKPRVTHWYRDAAVFERGPLVFSLPLEGQWTELKKYTEKSGDWQVTPERDWNFAVDASGCAVKAEETRASEEVPFNSRTPAIVLEVDAKRLPAWKEVENSAGPLPVSPVVSSGPLQRLSLVPYGAAKVRVTEFPYLGNLGNCQ